MISVQMLLSQRSSFLSLYPTYSLPFVPSSFFIFLPSICINQGTPSLIKETTFADLSRKQNIKQHTESSGGLFTPLKGYVPKITSQRWSSTHLSATQLDTHLQHVLPTPLELGTRHYSQNIVLTPWECCEKGFQVVPDSFII